MNWISRLFAPEPVRFCEDCKHFAGRKAPTRPDICTNPRVSPRKPHEDRLVRKKFMLSQAWPKNPSCRRARRRETMCGEKGRFWEAKP